MKHRNKCNSTHEQFADRAEKRKEAVLDSISHIDKYPDSAHVRLPVVQAMFACSATTIWRNVKAGRIPKPRKFASRITAWNLGDLRRALGGDHG